MCRHFGPPLSYNRQSLRTVVWLNRNRGRGHVPRCLNAPADRRGRLEGGTEEGNFSESLYGGLQRLLRHLPAPPCQAQSPDHDTTREALRSKGTTIAKRGSRSTSIDLQRRIGPSVRYVRIGQRSRQQCLLAIFNDSTCRGNWLHSCSTVLCTSVLVSVKKCLMCM